MATMLHLGKDCNVYYAIVNAVINAVKSANDVSCISAGVDVTITTASLS